METNKTNDPGESGRDIWNEPGAAGRALNRPVEPPPGQWEAIEARMKRRRRGFFWLWPLALLLVGGLSWVGYERFAAAPGPATWPLTHREERPAAASAEAPKIRSKTPESASTPSYPDKQGSKEARKVAVKPRAATEPMPTPSAEASQPAYEPIPQPDAVDGKCQEQLAKAIAKPHATPELGYALNTRSKRNEQPLSKKRTEVSDEVRNQANLSNEASAGDVVKTFKKYQAKSNSVEDRKMPAYAPAYAGVATAKATPPDEKPKTKPDAESAMAPVVTAAPTPDALAATPARIASESETENGKRTTTEPSPGRNPAQVGAVQAQMQPVPAQMPADTLPGPKPDSSAAVAVADTGGNRLYEQRVGKEHNRAPWFYLGLAGLSYGGLTHVGANSAEATQNYRLVKLGRNWGAMAKAGYYLPLSPAWGVSAEVGLGLLVQPGRYRVQPGGGAAFQYTTTDSLGFIANPQPTMEQDFRQETGLTGASLLLHYQLGALSLSAGGRFWIYRHLRQEGPAKATQGMSLQPVAGVALRLRPRLSFEALGQPFRFKEAAVPLPVTSQSVGGLYSLGLVWKMK